MSQTPGNDDPHDLESKFNEDTSDNLTIRSPDMYGYEVDDEHHRLPLGGILLGGVVIFVALIGVVYLAYTKGLQDGQKNLPPLIVADQAPIKVTPKVSIDNNISAGDLNIYDTIEGEAAGSADKDVSAEEKGDGSLETLYGDSQPSQQNDLDELNDFLGGAEADEPKVTNPIEPPKPVAEKPNLLPVPAEPEPTPPVEKAEKKAQPKVIDTNASVYIVQLSASRSMQQARTNFMGLRKKFPDLLQDREPMVQRADLGEKGIFFRLGIGGFDSRDAAKRFCNRLKAGGQDCLVRKIK